MLVHSAAVVVDDAIHPFEEAPEQGVDFLGAELAAEGRVAGEIGEQDGHLPPLALRLRQGRCRLRLAAGVTGVGAAQVGNGAQELAAVADRADADVLEVIGRQFGQDICIDGVVPERLLVLLQAQAV